MLVLDGDKKKTDSVAALNPQISEVAKILKSTAVASKRAETFSSAKSPLKKI
jgi:hypothetical protein